MDTATVHQVADRVEKLAVALGERAGGVDRGELECDSNVRLLKESGLLAGILPRQWGGDGLLFQGCTETLERLGRHDVSTALCLNMHNVAVGAVCEAASDERLSSAGRQFREWLAHEIVVERRMFASAVSEAGTGAKLRGIRTSYRRAGNGFVLNGHKSFVSLAGVADYFMVAARREGDPEDDAVSHFVVAATDPGVRFGELWRGAALAGTSTGEMFLDHVEVSRDRLVMGVEGMSLFALVRQPHWMVSGYTGVYLGLAQTLYVSVVRAAGRSDYSPVRGHTVGQLNAELRAARALVYSACATVDDRRGSIEANIAVHAAKYTVGRLLATLSAAVPAMCGSRALSAGNPLERQLREAQFCVVMPAKPDDCLEYLGKAALGFDMRDARSFDW